MFQDYRGFVDLHLHSTFSNLDGFGEPDEIVKRAKEIGRETIALTDHGSVSGLVKLKKACGSLGIKPIYGCEFYIVDSLSDMFRYKNRIKNHITVLASNLRGYNNLLQLASDSYHKGFYYKPTIDKELLFNNNEGLIVFSGCWSGRLQRMLKGGEFKSATSFVNEFKDVFGDRYYLETQHYPLFQDTFRYLNALSRKVDIPIVLTCDPHYLYSQDAPVQEVLHSIRDRRSFDEKQIIYGAYQWPVEELFEAVSSLFPEGDWDKLFNTVCEIGERCNVDMPLGGSPKFNFSNETSQSILLNKCSEGIIRRKLENAGEKYRERLRKEYKIILQKDFVDYFLIVADMVNWAKKNSILVGPARGSSAGSLICYLIGITEIDPLQYDLVFERFIDENRIDLPDIDVDFEDEKRDEVKQYITDKYGKDKVCSIVSFATFKGRNSLDEVGKIFGVPSVDIDTIKQNLIVRSDADEGANNTVQDTLNSIEEIKSIVTKNKNVRYAEQLEGQIRHMSTHAAGLIIGDRPLNEIIALYEKEGQSLSSVEMKDASILGLLKIDILGITELTVLRYICDMINWSIDDLYALTVDDPKTYEGFSNLDVGGIFQFDGDSTKSVLRQMQELNFDQLIACVALSKPGPTNAGCTANYLAYMNGNGKESCFNRNEKLINITKNTYYQIIYQEQALSIVREIGMLSWTDANVIRGLIGKSQGEQVLESYWDLFRKGAASNELLDSEARLIWDNIKTMGKYAFNKSHAVSYALLAYWSMYMKQHHQLEFYVAKLIKEKDKDKRTRLLLEIKEKGIKILPPVLGKSKENWIVEDGANLRSGLLEIDGIGDKVASSLVSGNYITVQDFGNKHDRNISKRTLSSLQKYNAFGDGNDDFLGLSRFEVLNKVCKNRTDLCNILETNDGMKIIVAGYINKINYKDVIENARAKGNNTDKIKDQDITRYAIVSLEDSTDRCLVFIDRYLLNKFDSILARARNDDFCVIMKGECIKNKRLINVKEVIICDDVTLYNRDVKVEPQNELTLF